MTPRATKAPMKAINCTILNAPRVRWAAIKAIIWSGVEVDEDLARVLEQSRLEAEEQVSLRAEGEEGMMARAMEESRQEQERRNMEQLELQRVRDERCFFVVRFLGAR